jgi:hypothetical protein
MSILLETENYKFYSKETKFEEDIILENDDIIYPSDTKEYKLSIIKELPTQFENYTDEQLKNELILLCLNKCSKQKSTNSINNLLKIFKSFEQMKSNNIKSPFDFTHLINYNKNLNIPILLAELTTYTEFIEEKDEMFNIVNDYIKKLNKINYSNKNLIEKQKEQYNYLKPFKEVYENKLENPFNTETNINELLYYFLFNNRNILENNIYNFLKKDYDFILLDNKEKTDSNILLNNIKNNNVSLINKRQLDKLNYRFLSNRKQNLNKNVKNIYEGDKTSLLGFYKNYNNSNNNFEIFNLQKYFDNIEELQVNNTVNLVLNYTNKNNIIKGKIKEIKTFDKYDKNIVQLFKLNNLIIIELEKEIELLNKSKTKIIKYDKNIYNNFYLFPENEEIYIKKFNNLKNEIILFPTDYMFFIQQELNNLDNNKDNLSSLDLELNKKNTIENLIKNFNNNNYIINLYNYLSKFINLESLELLKLNDNLSITNQDDFENMLIEQGYNINNEDITEELINILNKNIKDLKKEFDKEEKYQAKELIENKINKENKLLNNLLNFNKLIKENKQDFVFNLNNKFLSYKEFNSKNKYTENKDNQQIHRINYLLKQYDNGNILINQYLKNVIIKEYINLLKDFDIDINKQSLIKKNNSASDILKSLEDLLNDENNNILSYNLDELVKNIDKNSLKEINEKLIKNIKNEIKKCVSEIENLEKDIERLNKECEKSDELAKIHKIFYNEEDFNNNEKNELYKNKFVILLDKENNTFLTKKNLSNTFGSLFLNKNKKWDFIKYINLNELIEKNETEKKLPYCNNELVNVNEIYINMKDKESCIYDEYDEICKKRESIEKEYKLNILKNELSNLENKKEFIKYFKFSKNNIKLNNLLNDTIEYYGYSSITNKYKEIQLQKKKEIQYKNYQGDVNFVDFDKIYNNFEGTDYIPIVIEEEQISLTANKKDYIIDEEQYNSTSGMKQLQIYDILTRRILKKVGFMFNEKEIKHIVKSIDYFRDILMEKKLESVRSKNEKYKDKSKKDLIKLIFENDIERNKIVNQNLLFIICAFIIIITQIVYPNLKILKIDRRSIKYFSFNGYPANILKGQEKQLFFFVSNIIFNEFKEEYNLKDFTFVSSSIVRTIKTIITVREYYNKLLKNNIKNLIKIDNYEKDNNEVNDERKNYNDKAWDGYKPVLNVSTRPKTKLGNYLYEIYTIFDKSDKELYDIFNKPLIFNSCCKTILNEEHNYYNYIRSRIDVTEFLNKINKEEKILIKSKENFINYIKNVPEKENENILIFNKNIKLFDDNKLNEINIITEELLNEKNNDYYKLNENIKKIVINRERILNDEKMIKDIKDNKEWNNFNNYVSKLYEKLINILKKNSTLYLKDYKNKKTDDKYSYLLIDEDILENIKMYVLFFNDNNNSLERNHLLRIKRVLHKFNKIKILDILSKIKNLNIDEERKEIKEKKIDDNRKKRKLGLEDKIEEIENDIMNLNKLVNSYEDLKEWNLLENKDKFKMITDNLNIFDKELRYENLNDNLEDNENKKELGLISNKKEIYLLFYFILDSLYELFNLLIDKEKQDETEETVIYTHEVIAEKIKELNNYSGEENNNYIVTVSNIIYIILKILNQEFLDINKKTEDLKTIMDDYREQSKQKQIDYYNNLSIETKDILKLMKDNGIMVPEILDEEPAEGENVAEANVNVEITDDVIEETSYLNYVGENDDEINQD